MGIVPIYNPTLYYPDAMVDKYVVARGTTVAAEITRQVNQGIQPSLAAQDLFTRAVRYHEDQYYKKILGSILLIFNGHLIHSALPDHINLLSRDPIYYPVTMLVIISLELFTCDLAYDVLTSITNCIKFTPQYSI